MTGFVKFCAEFICFVLLAGFHWGCYVPVSDITIWVEHLTIWWESFLFVSTNTIETLKRTEKNVKEHALYLGGMREMHLKNSSWRRKVEYLLHVRLRQSLCPAKDDRAAIFIYEWSAKIYRKLDFSRSDCFDCWSTVDELSASRRPTVDNGPTNRIEILGKSSNEMLVATVTKSEIELIVVHF